MNNIMDFISVFIGLAILLSIGVVILGNGLQDCENIPGWNGSSTNATGWAKTCVENTEQSQNSYDLLSVILIVVAAVAILAVVRLL